MHTYVHVRWTAMFSGYLPLSRVTVARLWFSDTFLSRGVVNSQSTTHHWPCSDLVTPININSLKHWTTATAAVRQMVSSSQQAVKWPLLYSAARGVLQSAISGSSPPPVSPQRCSAAVSAWLRAGRLAWMVSPRSRLVELANPAGQFSFRDCGVALSHTSLIWRVDNELRNVQNVALYGNSLGWWRQAHNMHSLK